MSSSTITDATIVRDGRQLHALGPIYFGRCRAGWTDDRGRQYDEAFRLVCEECAAVGGSRGKVTTDTAGRTLCRDCRAGIAEEEDEA